MFEIFQRLEQYERKKARTPGEEVSDVAGQVLEGYFRSHPLPSERIAQIQKMIASERWPVVAERDLPVAYIFWANRAQELFAANKYAEAEAAALRSLKMQADEHAALELGDVDVLVRLVGLVDAAGAADHRREPRALELPRLGGEGHHPRRTVVAREPAREGLGHALGLRR